MITGSKWIRQLENITVTEMPTHQSTIKWEDIVLGKHKAWSCCYSICKQICSLQKHFVITGIQSHNLCRHVHALTLHSPTMFDLQQSIIMIINNHNTTPLRQQACSDVWIIIKMWLFRWFRFTLNLMGTVVFAFYLLNVMNKTTWI